MDNIAPKETNPKDAIGDTKLNISLVPDTIIAYMALAFTEGGLKYGAHNYTLAGARASVYISAAQRHIMKWKAGEFADPKTGVPHLGSVCACIAILAEADRRGTLVDDRPPASDIPDLLDSLMDNIAHLKELHGDKNPYHYTIADTEAYKGE